MPDGFCSDEPDEAEEYVSEWNFPYPGQHAFALINPDFGVGMSSLTTKAGLPKERMTYPGQIGFRANAKGKDLIRK